MKKHEFNPDAVLDDIISTLEVEHKFGVLLAAQLGQTPQELQLIIQTADYDEEKAAITTQATYVIRCIGVEEHRLSLGIFNRLARVTDDPLLWNYNQPYHQIYFKGHFKNPALTADGLMLELTQLYTQHYGLFRNLAIDLNRMAPLETLLKAGHGLLGEMPAPMAAHVKTLLERYGLTVTLVETEREAPDFPYQLLVMDDSYFIATLFGADLMGNL
jgi:hypothetical protein